MIVLNFFQFLSVFIFKVVIVNMVMIFGILMNLNKGG